MKTFALLLLMALAARGAEWVLTWDDTNAPGRVENFWIWRYVPAQGTNLTKLQLGGTGPNVREFTTTNYTPGIVNRYSVSAKNAQMEIESPVFTFLPMSAPFALTNKYASRRWTVPAAGWLQRSRDLVTWENHIHNDGSNAITVTVRERPEFPREFYRVNTNIIMPPLP